MRYFAIVAGLVLPFCTTAQVPKERVCNAAGLCAEVTTGAPAADSPALNVRSVGGGGGGTSSSFGAAFPADGTAAGAKVVSSPPTYSAGNMEAPTLDTAGNLRVNVVTGGGGGASEGTLGATAPSSGTQIAGPDGSNNLRAPVVTNSTPGGSDYGIVVRMAGAAAGGTSSNFGSTFPSAGTAAGFTDGTNMVPGKVTTTTPASNDPGIIVRVAGASPGGSAPGGVEAGGSGTLNGDGQTVECYTGDADGTYQGCFFRLTDSSLSGLPLFEGTVNGSTWEGYDCSVASAGPGAAPPTQERTTGNYPPFLSGVYYCQDSPSGGSFHAYRGIRMRMTSYSAGSLAVTTHRVKRVEVHAKEKGISVGAAASGTGYFSAGSTTVGDYFQRTREMPTSPLDGSQTFTGSGQNLFYYPGRYGPAKYVGVVFSGNTSGATVEFRGGAVAGLNPTGGYRPIPCWRVDSSGGTPLWSEGYVTSVSGNLGNKSYMCPWFYGEGIFFLTSTAWTAGSTTPIVVGIRESGMNIGMSSLIDATTGNLATISGNALNVYSASGMTVTGNQGMGDSMSVPSNSVYTAAFNVGYNGSTWDMLRSGGNAGDGVATSSVGVLSTGAYNLVFNGSNWDRARGNTSGAYVQGPAAQAATVVGNPVQIGTYAEQEAAALDTTNVAEGDINRAKSDIEGRLLVRTDHPYTWSCTRDAQTASGVCQASAASGWVITDVLLSNGATAQNIKVVYGTGSTCGTGQTVIIPATYLPVNGGAVIQLRTPVRLTGTVDLCCIISGSTAHSCRLGGHRGP